METVELERKRYQFYSLKFPFEEAGITQKTMHGQGLHTQLCCISQSLVQWWGVDPEWPCEASGIDSGE